MRRRRFSGVNMPRDHDSFVLAVTFQIDPQSLLDLDYRIRDAFRAQEIAGDSRDRAIVWIQNFRSDRMRLALF